MTQSELKELTNLGAELGAAKAENDRLRRLLVEAFASLCDGLEDGPQEAEWSLRDRALAFRIKDALSQQPVHSPWTEDSEGADSSKNQYTATDMINQSAQAFRDGQAAVEPAPAQDELPVVAWRYGFSGGVLRDEAALPEWKQSGEYQPLVLKEDAERAIAAALAARPAQTAPQPEQSRPANKLRALAEIWDQNADEADEFGNAQAAEALRLAAFELRATLSAPQGKFRMGDLVKKSTGSEWVGRVVGTYSTEQTKEGYAVESSAHRNSVQIYPAKALEAVE